MFDDVYDNGYYLLGKARNLRVHLQGVQLDKLVKEEDYSEVKDMLEELNDYREDDIILINYENPMGYTIEVFRYEDKIKY